MNDDDNRTTITSTTALTALHTLGLRRRDPLILTHFRVVAFLQYAVVERFNSYHIWTVLVDLSVPLIVYIAYSSFQHMWFSTYVGKDSSFSFIFILAN